MDTPSRLTLRIFVSSPGDVPVERDRAADVIARLQEEFVHYAVLEPFFWEDQPARATDTFQSQFPEASGMDIVVGILWARIGTPLPLDKARPDGRRYESGTVYELETAAESYRSRGTPDLVVYRRTSDPSLPLHDEAERQRRLEQLEALEAFIRRWFFHDDGSFKAAFHTFKTPDQFEQQLETHLRKLIREKVEKAEQPGGPGEGEIVFHGVPYPGLKVFGLEDAPVFYGRARALAAVKEALQAQAGRNCAFLLIFGMSGSGKSSLVRAGLVHALTATPGWIEGVDVWRWCVVRPGDATGDPLDALAQAFFGDTALPELRAGGIDAARLARTLRDNPDDVDLILGPALRAVAASERERRAADRPLEARLLVVVDQMEELFTRDWLDEPGRARYVAALAAPARSGTAWVVATMRSEFFARCAELPELVALKAGQGQLDLLPPTFAEIGQMIRYPARDAALRWGKDPDHPGQTLDDVLQEAAWRDPKALPLLQFTLNELFRRRDGRTLTCEAYRALGGLEGALANHAEATLAALPPEVQAALPALLRALVTAGEGDHEPVVSRRVPLEPLRDRSHPPAAARRPDRCPAARDRPRRPDAAGRRHRARGLAHALAAAQGPAGQGSRVPACPHPRRDRRRALAAGEPRRRFPAPRGQAARRGPRAAQDPARRPRPRDDRIHRPLDPLSDAPAPPPHARDRHDHRDRLERRLGLRRVQLCRVARCAEQKQSVREARRDTTEGGERAGEEGVIARRGQAAAGRGPTHRLRRAHEPGPARVGGHPRRPRAGSAGG